MAQLTLDNGEARVTHRTKINDNFLEVYTNIDAQTIVSVIEAVVLTSTAFGKVHVCTGTSADYTITLPTAASVAGKSIAIKGEAALTKVVTVACDGAETIDGYATRKIAQHGLFVVMSDGANWVMVNEVGSWIPYTVTYTGFSSNPTGGGEYFRVGKMVKVRIQPVLGTSNATTFTLTFPFNSAIQNYFHFFGFNNSAGISGRGVVTAGSDVFTLFTTAGGAAWTASGSKGVYLDITYKI